MKQVSLEERCSWHWVLTGKSVSGRGRQSSPGKGICVADKLSSTFYEAHTSDSGFLLGVYKKQDKAETRSKTHPFHSINPFLFHATHFSVFVEMFFLNVALQIYSVDFILYICIFIQFNIIKIIFFIICYD